MNCVPVDVSWNTTGRYFGWMSFFISLSFQGFRPADDEYIGYPTEPKCRGKYRRRDRIRPPGRETKSGSVSPHEQIGKEKRLP